MTSAAVAFAKTIASKDNGVHTRNGAVFFSVRKPDPKAKSEKKAIDCAIEFAKAKKHAILIKYTPSKSDHQYGSYETVKAALGLLNAPKSHSYEIVPADLPRYFYADVEFNPQTLVEGDGLAPEDVVDRLINFISDYASEVCGHLQCTPETGLGARAAPPTSLRDVHAVSRNVQIASSEGESNSKNWVGLEKASYHIKFDFAFADNLSCRAFATAVHNRLCLDAVPYMHYTDKDGKLACVFDRVPYLANQSWRCLYSSKFEDTDAKRALKPIRDSSTLVEDHLIGIYTPEELTSADVIPFEAKKVADNASNRKRIAAMRKDREDLPVSCKFEIPQELFLKVAAGLSADRAHGWGTWSRAIWCMYNVCAENDYLALGLEQAHEFSKQSSKYCHQEVDAMWASTTYRENGLQWPTFRSWLWDDNRKLWKTLRAHTELGHLMAKEIKATYENQYLPHIDDYKDVFTTCTEYTDRYVPPFDMEANDVLVEHSPMDTRKTAQLVDLILSGRYESILLWVNRQTLCRSFLNRINGAICEAKGEFVPELMFRDYRRPEEVEDPTTQLEGVEDYLIEVEGDDDDAVIAAQPPLDFTKYPFLVVQMESAYKVQGPAPNLIVIDECESDLAQFSSPTMKRLRDCSEVFWDYLKAADKVLLMDAFISDKTLTMLRHAFQGTHKRLSYRRNLWKAEGRQAYQIEGTSSAALKKLTTEAILAKLGAGEKVVLFTTNNEFGMATAKTIQEKLPDKQVLIYNKFTDDLMKDKHFDSVDKYWVTADIVIHSPVLLAGVSFNIPDYFDCLFVFAYNESSSVRDIFQATGRVRKYKSQTMYYALDTFGPRKFYLSTTYSAVENRVDEYRELFKKYIKPADKKLDSLPGDHISIEGRLSKAIDNDQGRAEDDKEIGDLVMMLRMKRKTEKLPAWLKDIHIRNTWEQNLTHNPVSFQTVFEDFLAISGWEQAGTLTKDNVLDWVNIVREGAGEAPKKARKVQKVVRDYESIAVLDKEGATRIERKRNRGQASNVEKMQLERYWFDHKVVCDSEAPLDLRKRVFDVLDNLEKKRLLYNLWAEARLDPAEAADESAEHNPYVELMDKTPAILAAMKRLCTILGLENSHDAARTIHEDVLKKNLVPLQDVWWDLQNLLNTSKKPLASKDPALLIKLKLNRVLMAFSKGKLAVSDSWQNRDDGRITHYSYRLKSNDSFVADVVRLLG